MCALVAFPFDIAPIFHYPIFHLLRGSAAIKSSAIGTRRLISRCKSRQSTRSQMIAQCRHAARRGCGARGWVNQFLTVPRGSGSTLEFRSTDAMRAPRASLASARCRSEAAESGSGSKHPAGGGGIYNVQESVVARGATTSVDADDDGSGIYWPLATASGGGNSFSAARCRRWWCVVRTL